MNFIRRNDKWIAIIFSVLTIAFLLLTITNKQFFAWVFERHQNTLSWYIRPVFIIPFCYFAYQHSRAGISITIFCLFTSMFWFNQPATVSDEVQTFLQFEKDWLSRQWDLQKILLVLSVPISFTVLGLAFWKRSLWMGLAVIILIATGKITWSIMSAGESGKSIIIPAILGLIVCVVFIFLGYKRLENKRRAHR